ncbi:hypothetical protein [Paraburkholderia ferrariae]|uniref:hypothetical protein n=1 Tax=Paraburkholderia ferrariae TaxID=386056 RepID=UPI00048970F9|nr:hypothetical protein [Paraburkholderia ferrariae]
MKPLLRVVLIVDALMLLGFGVLFLLTPWASLFDALQLVQPQPAFVGQVFGVVLLGFAWLAARAAFDGAMTAPVGRVAGHLDWIAGVLLLVWLIGLHTPRLTGFGQLLAGALGAWLILVGFGLARLAAAVRRREKALAAEAAAAERDARDAAKRERRQEPVTYAAPVFAGVAAPATSAVAAPVEPPVERAAPPVPASVSEPASSPASPVAPLAGSHTTVEAEAARRAARDEAAGAPRPPLRG